MEGASTRMETAMLTGEPAVPCALEGVNLTVPSVAAPAVPRAGAVMETLPPPMSADAAHPAGVTASTEATLPNVAFRVLVSPYTKDAPAAASVTEKVTSASFTATLMDSVADLPEADEALTVTVPLSAAVLSVADGALMVRLRPLREAVAVHPSGASAVTEETPLAVKASVSVPSKLSVWVPVTAAPSWVTLNSNSSSTGLSGLVQPARTASVAAARLIRCCSVFMTQWLGSRAIFHNHSSYYTRRKEDSPTWT